MPPASPSQFVALIPNITVGMPYLRNGKPSEMFAALRNKIIEEAGFDFLNNFGDMMRPRGFQTNKAGVSNKSRHKCGDAFDYNQGHANLVVIQEPRNDEMYFRTYLKCAKQDGTQGVRMTLPPSSTPKYYCDFTTLAEALGWHRIRAQHGWEQVWNKREFWHYQMTEGYSFEEALELLYGDRDGVRVQPEYPDVRLGDRDNEEVYHARKDVRQVQAQLYLLGLLQPLGEIDGRFGPKSETAVRAFQEQVGQPVTGVADSATRSAMLERILS